MSQNSSDLQSLFDLLSGFNSSGIAKKKAPLRDFLNKKGDKLKFNPITGEFIDPGDRRSVKKAMKNPLRINAGNAINPFVPEVPNFLGGVQMQDNPISRILGGL